MHISKNRSELLSRCLSILRVNSETLNEYKSYVKTYETVCYGHVEENRLVVGSSSDGTFRKESDKDFMRILLGFRVIASDMIENKDLTDLLIADHLNLGPGFTYLRIPIQFNKEKLPGTNKENLYFKSDEFIEAKRQVTASVPPYFGPYKTISKGTSVTRIHQNKTYDDVYAIECLQWPKEASEWISRERLHGWPSAELIQVIKNSKCYVVPDAKSGEACWRYVFPEAEREIMWSLNDVQVQCFSILKYFREVRLDEVAPAEINSFHLKMTLFWLLENSPNDFWVPENLIMCLKEYIKTLQEHIVEKNLPHYLLRERNTFAAKLQEQQIREKLVNELQKIYDNIENDIMDYQINETSLKTALEIIEGTITEEPLPHTEATEKLLELAKVKMFAKIKMNENIYTFYHIVNRISCSEDIARLRSYYDVSRRLHYDQNHSSSIYMKFNKHFTQVKLGIHVLKEAIDRKADSDKLLKEAEQYFSEGQTFDGFAGKMYLVTYYVFCKNYTKANDVLDELLRCEKYCSCAYTKTFIFIKNGSCGILQDYSHTSDWELAIPLQLFFNEKHLFPLAIQYEICVMKLTERSEHGNYYTFAVVHQYVYFRFMQFLIHKYLLRSDIEEFDKAVRESKDLPISKYHINLNLLGYCYMTEGFIAEGLKCFIESLSVFPKEENMAAYYLCFYALNKDCRLFH